MLLDTGDTMFNSPSFAGLRRMLVIGLMASSVSGFAQDDLVWNALDPDNTARIEALACSLANDGITSIWVTHDREQQAQQCPGGLWCHGATPIGSVWRWFSGR